MVERSRYWPRRPQAEVVQQQRHSITWPREVVEVTRYWPQSPAMQRRNEIRKQVAVTVLMRQGLTRAEAEEQFEMGRI